MASGLAGYTDYYDETTGQPLKRLVVRPEVAATVESGSANSLGPAETGEGNPFGDFLSRLSEVLGKSSDNLLGLNGKERYQLWPERLVREGLSAAHDVMSGEKPAFAIDPVTGEAHTSPQMIEAGQAMSALAGTGGLGGVGAEAGTSLGSGPFLRPALKYGEKLYKGKEGQQHLDLIPADLYPTFQKQAMNGDDISHWNFGFYNDKGHFLTRDKALQYGIDNGIIDPQSGKFGALTSTMMSDSSKPGAVIAANKPFYSGVENALLNAKQGKADAAQWLGYLKNQPGVKQEELQHLGLDKLSGPITKDDLLKAVQEGQPQIKQIIKTNRDTGEIQRDSDGTVLPTTNETKYSSYQLPGGPLSRDTEILTNRGWKRIDTVRIGDVVMTRKDTDGVLEWQPVLDTPSVYAENLYHFLSQSINMRVTENHQMIAKKRRRNQDGLIRLTAKELWNKSEMLVPLTGVWSAKGDDDIFGFNPNDLAELFGWYVAEGSCKLNSQGRKNTIQIAQSKEYNPEKCERIEALLDRMNLPWCYYGDAYGIGIKTISKDLVELFHEQPTSEFKFIPYFFFEQNKSVIQSLLDGLILGDGCTSVQEGRLDKTTFFTKSQQLADDVQVLALLVGKCANVRQRPSGLYYVGIKSKEWSSVDEAKFEIAPYNDFAFCVTVENHAIYVRRNGIAAFTGNSNYREMLLTLPDNSLAQKLRSEAERRGYGDKISEWPDKEFAQKYRDNVTNASDVGTYKSSHWDEPNVLAHIRMNDRNIDGKKTLHVEEIQSDWHQAGRKHGYKSNNDAKKSYDDYVSNVRDRAKEQFMERAKTANMSEIEANRLFNETMGETKSPVHAARYIGEEDKLNDLLMKLNEKNNAVPDAPFKKTWDELAIKNVLDHAVKNGYDQVSWTPGEAQAARYDLSKQVSRLMYNTKTNQLEGYGLGGNRFINKTAKPEELPDIVGKDVADKLLNNPTEIHKGINTNELKGQDLKVGGEGMKAFYDKMLVDKFNALGKKYGAKVSKAELPLDTKKPTDFKDFADWEKAKAENRKQSVYTFPITPKLREQIKTKGQPLFSAGLPIYTPIDYDPFKEQR